jgi:RNA recognition motif-containing protein
METVMSNTQQYQQQQNSRYQNSISSTPSSLSTSGASSTSTSSSSAALSTNSHQDASNLIVNYLPQTMTEIELRTLFEKIDYVERCKLITNRWNNQSLCYGFVKYAKVESADLAIKSLNGLKLENKIIKVSELIKESIY